MKTCVELCQCAEYLAVLNGRLHGPSLNQMDCPDRERQDCNRGSTALEIVL